MSAPPRRILLTGAAGRIGSCLRPALREGASELRLTDRTPLVAEHPVETVARAELEDRDAVRAAMAGMEAVVHLGATPSERPFDEIAGPNLHGTFHVFEEARRAGVRRVVFASSNHATGFTPVGQPMRGDEAARPDSLYGVSKAYGEALGRLYVDKFGLEVACVRIGTFAARPVEARQLATWLSPGDAIRLFRALLTAPGLGFAVVYGASANTRGWWDLEPARALGYAPQDDAEAFAADVGEGPMGDFQGGEFTARDAGGWAD